jgi:3D (Asp-Asp-Asp) domain-containing protein
MTKVVHLLILSLHLFHKRPPMRIQHVWHAAKVLVTAYTAPPDSLTYSGEPVHLGVCAVDPRVIPLGVWLYVMGYGWCRALDTGALIKGRRVDVYLPSYSAALDWGARKMEVLW